MYSAFVTRNKRLETIFHFLAMVTGVSMVDIAQAANSRSEWSGFDLVSRGLLP